ncbi:hypothetical protein G7B40_012260 [Aetokthonos hydrillicola Thurmond2011]|uniref:Uncharacterized protein n=1 Tax=Aetokthonos hydrillicola Thurmond2011 TaxID=2712845 RepID=A0AAP5I5Y1_9CYAN|nr:hypothetical protein [Aetokthonos hydrillicola CCALA 1050]MDR9895334.1 hypothetical protein [Aetokthonos hydrillicola Thurmond2011]
MPHAPYKLEKSYYFLLSRLRISPTLELETFLSNRIQKSRVRSQNK